MSKKSDFNIERNFLRKWKKLSLFRRSNFQNKLSMVENQNEEQIESDGSAKSPDSNSNGSESEDKPI